LSNIAQCHIDVQDAKAISLLATITGSPGIFTIS
jgi:hypothetical protein